MLKIIKTYLKKIFRRPINIKKSWVEEPSQYSDIVSFLNWFDKTSSLENTKSKAETDWGLLIANFPEYDIINKNNSLEIGFGGGRLLVQAANNFKNVYGVDIHNSFDKTREY
jgi:tRNA G46 methylase TrmB